MASSHARRSAIGTIRLAAVVLLPAGLGVFAFQNTAPIELRLFGWTFQSRRIALIAGTLVVGIVIGWLLGRRR